MAKVEQPSKTRYITQNPFNNILFQIYSKTRGDISVRVFLRQLLLINVNAFLFKRYNTYYYSNIKMVQGDKIILLHNMSKNNKYLSNLGS